MGRRSSRCRTWGWPRRGRRCWSWPGCGSRIEALTAKVLDHGDILKVGTATDEDGDAPSVPGSTAAWFASETALTRNKGRDALRMAKRLEDAFHATSRALAAGRVNADQALVIVTAVDALPDFVDEPDPTRRRGLPAGACVGRPPRDRVEADGEQAVGGPRPRRSR